MHDELILPAGRLLRPPGLWIPRMEFAPSRRCCCEGGGPCEKCNGTPPAQLQIDFTNVVNGGNYGDCEDCATYYGNSFLLDIDATNKCLWEFLEGDWCPGCPSHTSSTKIDAEYRISGSDYRLRVDVYECNCCNPATTTSVLVARFEYDSSTSKPACVPASPLSLTPIDAGSWNPWSICLWDDAVVTCTVTAV